jgi:hypothetical protein
MKLVYRYLMLVSLALGGWASSASAAPESGNVTVAVGEVTFTDKEGNSVVVKAGDKVAVGGTVKTGAAARAVVVITPRSAIRVAENSEVLIVEVTETSTPNRVMLDLKSGSVGALLKPNAAGELDFKIRTPSGIAAARGTYFSVAVENGKGFAQVKEGRVEIIPAKAEEDPN